MAQGCMWCPSTSLKIGRANSEANEHKNQANNKVMGSRDISNVLPYGRSGIFYQPGKGL